MIVDITNEILTDIRNELEGITVLSSFQPVAPKFPTVIIEEIDNSADITTKDSSGFTHSNIGFSVEIYTNGNSRMTRAKELRNRIDAIISRKYGLTRNVSEPIPNYLDASIYRYRMLYTGKINENKKIYRG